LYSNCEDPYFSSSQDSYSDDMASSLPEQQEDFMDFISTASSSPPRSKTIGTMPDITEDDLQFFSEYHSRQKSMAALDYSNFTTSLDFGAFETAESPNMQEVSHNTLDDPSRGGVSFTPTVTSSSITMDSDPVQHNDAETSMPAAETSSKPPFKVETNLASKSSRYNFDDEESRSYAFESIESSDNGVPGWQAQGDSDATVIPTDTMPPPQVTTQTANTETITVQVSALLPADISIHHAKQAWLEYCWKQGGGIMVPTFGVTSSTGDRPENDIPSTREFLIPWGLKQELVDVSGSVSNKKDLALVGYRTTRRGPFWQDVVPRSHMATVEFVPERTQQDYRYTTQVPPTRMIWKVRFDVPVNDNVNNAQGNATDASSTEEEEVEFAGVDHPKVHPNTRLRHVLSKTAFWKAWTSFQLKAATKNFLSHLETPSNLITIDHTETLPRGVSPQQALEAWYEYCWCGGGGGATLIPPLHFQQGRQRWILPALLEEEIMSMDYDEPCHVIYQVNNPNPFTFPVHYHQGTVRFKQHSADAPTVLLWNVQVRPYRKYVGYGVQFWTKTSMARASRNLSKHLENIQDLSQESTAVLKHQQSSQWPSIRQGSTRRRRVALPEIPNFFSNVKQSEPSATLQVDQKPQTNSWRRFSFPTFSSLVPNSKQSESFTGQRATFPAKKAERASSTNWFPLSKMPDFAASSNDARRAENGRSVDQRATLQVDQPPPQSPRRKDGFSLPKMPNLYVSIGKYDWKNEFCFPSLLDFSTSTQNLTFTDVASTGAKQTTVKQSNASEKSGFSLPTALDLSARQVSKQRTQIKQPLMLRKTLVLQARTGDKKVFILPRMPKFSFIENNGGEPKKTAQSGPRRKTLIVVDQQKETLHGKERTSAMLFPRWNIPRKKDADH
jgi:hypothetical protein